MVINISSKKPYDIIIERNALENIGSLFLKYSNAKKVAVISDDNIARLYAGTVLSSLKKNNVDAFLFCIPSGENSKNINAVTSVLEFFSKIGLGKHDCVIALGGGVIGDVAGFSASIYMRGIQFINIPTTLLAQVDSAIGEENGVNINTGKNLCGTFWAPTFVLVDSALLSTLPKKYFTDGLAEIIKYAMIADKELFELLENNKPIDLLDDIICRCINIKKKFLETNDSESNDILALNFGHTLGATIERYSNYTLLHGQSVGLGMLIMCSLAEDKAIYQRLRNLLKKVGLPYKIDYSVKYLFEYIKNDKKKQNSNISLIHIKEIGCYHIEKTEISNFYDYFK